MAILPTSLASGLFFSHLAIQGLSGRRDPLDLESGTPLSHIDGHHSPRDRGLVGLVMPSNAYK